MGYRTAHLEPIFVLFVAERRKALEVMVVVNRMEMAVVIRMD